MSETQSEYSIDLVEAAAAIVAAFVSFNALSATDLPQLIAETHAALLALATKPDEGSVTVLVPAVSIKKSITPDHLICLEDGEKFRTLKRHLRTHYNLSPQDYRERWGLPADYPMVAPSYSETRASLARANGLGRKVAVAKASDKPDRKKIGLAI